MKKSSVLFLIVSLLPIFALAAASPLYRSLQLGDRGPDVKWLQAFFNKDATTHVATAGAGSPGQETDYFGDLTKQAAVLFQEKYAQFILVPLGLSSATGYVGPATIGQINRLETATTSNQTLAAPAAASKSANSNSGLSSGLTSVVTGQASSAAGAGPFGGRVEALVSCNCSGDYVLMDIRPAARDLPKSLMYSASKATTYQFKIIPKIGIELLGWHDKDVACKVTSGDGCDIIGYGKDVIFVGTSGGRDSPPELYTQPYVNYQNINPTTTPPTTFCLEGGANRQAYVARGTGYYPDSSELEGGFVDRRGLPLQTLQDYLAGRASYVSVAMDPDTFSYGTKLCIPELESKYNRPIDFRVVDTGGAFIGKGTSRIDICTANQAVSVDPTINGTLTLVVNQ